MTRCHLSLNPTLFLCGAVRCGVVCACVHTRYGRVDYILGRRLQLLDDVQRLSECFEGVRGAFADTCENAEHFYRYHVLAEWEK